MRSKIFLNLLAAALLVALAAVAASAQMVTASGRVTIKQADGSVVPAAGGVVKFYRTDIKAEYTSKIDKNGNYVNVGIPLIGTYTIVASAPGAAPNYYANIRISQRQENNFELDPGDGSSLTPEQIKAANTGAPAGSPAAAANTEEAKKRAAALAAETARVKAENEKAMAINAKLPEIMKAGGEAFEAANKASDAKKFDEALRQYDEAIKQFDLGTQVDPTQSVFYLNKAIALRSRGRDRYNSSLSLKDAAAKKTGIEAAREDFKAAVEAAEKSVTTYRQNKKGGAPGDLPSSGGGDELGYLAARAETYRVALQTTTPVDNAAAAAAIEEYIKAETDPAKKDKMQASLGDALFFAGQFDEAIAKYRETLAKNPNNLDAMYGLGFALAAKISDASKDGALIVEARDTLQEFVSKAPDTHPRKRDAVDSIKYLEDTMKSAAYKPPAETSKPKAGGRKKP